MVLNLAKLLFFAVHLVWKSLFRIFDDETGVSDLIPNIIVPLGLIVVAIQVGFEHRVSLCHFKDLAYNNLRKFVTSLDIVLAYKRGTGAELIVLYFWILRI